jgi:hypothetical protein
VISRTAVKRRGNTKVGCEARNLLFFLNIIKLLVEFIVVTLLADANTRIIEEGKISDDLIERR